MGYPLVQLYLGGPMTVSSLWAHPSSFTIVHQLQPHLGHPILIWGRAGWIWSISCSYSP